MLSTWCPCWPSSIRVVYTIQAVQGACVTRKRVENFEVVELSVCSRVVTQGHIQFIAMEDGASEKCATINIPSSG